MSSANTRETELQEKEMQSKYQADIPRNEPARFFWYAQRCLDLMTRSDWQWTTYQCLIYFAHVHRREFGVYGDYNLARDLDTIANIRKSLAADDMDIQEAIDCYLVGALARDPFLRNAGHPVRLFKTSLNKIKKILHQRKTIERCAFESCPHTCIEEGECELFTRWNLSQKLFNAQIAEGLEFCAGDGWIEKEGTPYSDGRRCDRWQPKEE